jgi:hypothetical protein
LPADTLLSGEVFTCVPKPLNARHPGESWDPVPLMIFKSLGPGLTSFAVVKRFAGMTDSGALNIKEHFNVTTE